MAVNFTQCQPRTLALRLLPSVRGNTTLSGPE